MRGAPERVRELFEERGGHGPNDGNVFLCCPFCPERVGKEDFKYKLNVRVSGEARLRPRGGGPPEPFECSYEAAVWGCYRCGAKGLDDFSWLISELGRGLNPQAPEHAAEEPLPPAGFQPLNPANRDHWPACHYLSRVREVDVLRAAVAAGAGICAGLGSAKKYRGRVVVPCLDPETRAWRGFVARSIVPGDSIPYLTPRRMPRAQIVWGLEHEALREPGAPVYVVEGVFDALAVFPYGVAPLGKGVQVEQLDLLAEFSKRTGRPLVPCLDGDAPRDNEYLDRALRVLRGAEVPHRITLPVGQDPGKLGWRILDYVPGNDPTQQGDT